MLKNTISTSLIIICLFASCQEESSNRREGYWYAESIAKQSMLTIIDESYHHLSEDILKYQNIRRLNIINVGLEEAPTYIDQLKKLEFLNLPQNKLSQLPETLVNLPKLKKLNLSNNNFSELPKIVFSLSNLEELDLRYNKLTALPTEITNTKIYIGGNEITNEERKKLRNLMPLTKIIAKTK